MPLPINEMDCLMGKKITFCRKKLQWPLKTLASSLNISLQQLQRYEKGINKIPASLIYQIAKIFHVSVFYFFSNPLSKLQNIEKKDLIIYSCAEKIEEHLLLQEILSKKIKNLSFFSFDKNQDWHEFLQRASLEEGEQLSPPNLIFLYLNFFDSFGLSLIKKIKNEPFFKNIPLLILTNSTEKKFISQAYLLGASGLIESSTDSAELGKTLENIVTYWTKSLILPPSEEKTDLTKHHHIHSESKNT